MSDPQFVEIKMEKFSFNRARTLSRLPKMCGDHLRRELPDFSHEFIDAALRGDREAAGMLSATDNNCRPLVLLCLFATCPDSAGFKEAMMNIWSHDGPLVLRTIESRLLTAMLQRGGTPLPYQAEPVVVYRGGQGDLNVVRRGWSWTTRRGVAAWFANRYPERGEPLVVEARVRSTRILHVCNERNEHEVVIAQGVRRAVASGTPDDWTTEASEWRASIPTTFEPM
jgi:hypothetical protein